MEPMQLSTAGWISFILLGLGVIVCMLIMGWQILGSPYPVEKKDRLRMSIVSGMLLPAIGFLVLAMVNIWVGALPWTEELIALLLCTYLPFAAITSWSVFVQLFRIPEM